MEVKQESVDIFCEEVKVQPQTTLLISPDTIKEDVETTTLDYHSVKLEPLDEQHVDNTYTLGAISTNFNDITEVKVDDYFVDSKDLVVVKREADEININQFKTELLNDECDLPTVKSEINSLDDPCCSTELQVKKTKKGIVKKLLKKKKKHSCPVCMKSPLIQSEWKSLRRKDKNFDQLMALKTSSKKSPKSLSEREFRSFKKNNIHVSQVENSYHKSQHKRQKFKYKEDDMLTIKIKMRHSLKNNEQDNKDRLFLLSLLPELKKIPEQKKLCTKIQIQEIILKAQDISNDY